MCHSTAGVCSLGHTPGVSLGRLQMLRRIREYLALHRGYAQVRARFKPHRIRSFRDQHKSDAIFCVGTGPSLSQTDISLLNDRTVILVNGAFRLLDSVKPAHTYWFIQDHRRLYTYLNEDRRRFDASFRSFHEFRFPTIAPPLKRDDVVILPEVTWSRFFWPIVQAPGPNFSSDLSQSIGMTPTVIFSAIQLAAYMGAKVIILIGVDMNYTGEAAHFYQHPEEDGARLFGTYERNYRPVFAEYDRLLNAESRRLINCTPGTKEDVLPHDSLANVCQSLRRMSGLEITAD
jgi:hypothetical protein